MSARSALTLLACLAALGACGPFASSDRESSLSIDEELELTEDVSRQLLDRARFVDDPVLLAYVDEIGQSIADATRPQPFPYRFAIIDDPALNAFTIGGGHIYVHSGVLAQAGDVAEIAGVLAHEIAHVRERHVVRRQEGQGLATLLTVAAAAAVVAAGADPELLMAAQGLNVALQLKNSRMAESEADYEGIQYLVRAGYAPRGMTRFFQRILLESPRASATVPSYLFTHPAVKERITATQAQIARMELPGSLRVRDDRLAGMQERLAMLQARMAGGSGLLARSQFDRTLTEPLLDRAEELRKQGALSEADEVLVQAQESEEGDPRVALARGRLAETRQDWALAREQFQRAFDLDPGVALARYELGRFHASMGERRRALFYLDQAAIAARPRSRLRQTIERELSLVLFPPFQEVTVQGMDPRSGTARLDTQVECAVTLDARAAKLGLPLVVTWYDATRQEAKQERIQADARGRARARYRVPATAAPGTWTIELRMGEGQRRELEFEVSGD